MAIYRRSDGFDERDLLHAAVDHLASARRLFEGGPRCYDSAGYLCHVGIELILKAFLLHSDDEFPGWHSLAELLRKSSLGLDAALHQTIALLDGFAELRYPTPEPQGVEIGVTDWGDIHVLYITLVQLMPPDLRSAYDEIDYGEKVGRIVMWKPVGPFESMADQLDAIEREAAARFSFRKTPPRGGSS
jgi:HEPN domain-containing protein